MVFTPDDEFRQAKLARIRAQTEGAQASAEKDRSIANDLAGIRRVIKGGQNQLPGESDPLKELEVAQAEEELLDQQLRIARKRLQLQRFNETVTGSKSVEIPDLAMFDEELSQSGQERSDEEFVRSIVNDPDVI